MTQAEALKIMLTGANVFLTGEPGAGKTYTLDKFIEQAEEDGKNVAITASTGIAASHINGVTVHSWSGLGILDVLSDGDLARLKSIPPIVARYEQADILVIDEISMLHGKRLDMVDRVARTIRKKDQPFGGMQVILVGDLFQLPPVNRDGEDVDFAHHSQSWQNLDLKICYLTEQHRQEDDDGLLKILQAMRTGHIRIGDVEILKRRIIESNKDSVTRLYSHNADVDAINQQHLDALPGKPKQYQMTSHGDAKRVEQLKRNILAPATLKIKVGAEVMFVANNFDAGFFNGTRGRVVKIKDGRPTVKLQNGHTVSVRRHTWQTKIDWKVVAQVEQFPLRLAWAITIHKSQGMSLDSAEVDLSRAFMPGMGYVALSRVRSLEGLYLSGINDMALAMHDEIYDFDKQLREMSEVTI